MNGKNAISNGKAKDQTPITNYLRREEKAVRDEIRSITSNIKEGVKKVENNIEKDIKLIDKESKENPFVVKGLIFLAFAIPVAILLYFLYINFLPFGYSETPLNLNLSEIQWDYDWYFTEGVPSDFQGTAEFDPQE